MPDPIIDDEQLRRTAGRYFARVTSQAAPPHLAENAVRFAFSRRRRFSLAALLGGTAIVLVGAAAAAVVLAFRHGPVAGLPAVTPSASSSQTPNPTPSLAFGRSPTTVPVSGAVTLRPVHLHVSGMSNFAPVLRGGHVLYRRGVQLVYDSTVVAAGTSNQGVADWTLSANGLHYAYTFNSVLHVDGVSFDSAAVALLTVPCLSNDGMTALSIDSSSSYLYRVTRNSKTLVQTSVDTVVGSSDCQHFLAVVPNSGGNGYAVVRDGTTVLPSSSGVDPQAKLFISPSGNHWGVQGVSSTTGTWIDGRQVLPANEPSFWGQVTDLGHWVVFDQARSSVVVDGQYYGLTGGDHNIVAINPDASHRAVMLATQVRVDGKAANLPPNAQMIEFDGNTLLVSYYT